jgi:protein tyrosine/serine phosphatase
MNKLQYATLCLAMALSPLAHSADLPAQAADIPNFHKVNDHVFRGGQPGAQGWPSLAQMGVKLVIDLRREDEHSSAAEEQAVRAAGMNYINVPMKGVSAPSAEQVNKLLSLLSSPDPVFVHCKRGADRTGAIIACYRIEHDHWSAKQALSEAKLLGMAWDQFGLKHYVNAFRPTPNRTVADTFVMQKAQ